MIDDPAPAPLAYGLEPPGFRLPAATRVGAVRLQVRDLRRAVDYYTRVIGLRVLGQTVDEAVLGAHGDDTALVRLHARADLRPAPPQGAFGLYHFAILLPGRATLGCYLAHLAALRVPVGAADHRVSEALYLTDPDGLGIEVYADRPRHEWRPAGRELLITSDPLDLDGLRAAGAAQAWSGVPGGTTIGHVHLHVGDLDEARRFYHQALGFDLTVWRYPGALFLSAGGYHHHLGVNTWAPGPAATADQARLLEWELVVPGSTLAAAAGSLRAAGYTVDDAGDGVVAPDPWGTRLRIRSA